MAVPAPTARTYPALPNRRLKAGFKSVITFASQPGLALWCISYKPAGINGGDPIDIATMEDQKTGGANATRRPMAPRERITSTPASMKCAYDPGVEDLLESSIINRTNDVITETYRDGTTKAYHGFMMTFEKDEIVEGQMPTATVQICESDWDESTQTVDGPVITSVTGS